MRVPSLRQLPVVSLLAGLAVAAASCASSPSSPDEPPAREAALEPGIYAVESGKSLTRNELYRRLGDADYVAVGESHSVPWHHTIQRRIFLALLEQRDGRIALGMEMFERPYQPALDAYIDGAYDESEMLEETEWEKSWGMDVSLYRPLWRTARRHNAPIAALNVPRRLTRTIARKGLDGLDDEARARLPDTIDTSIEAQREYLKTIFSFHGGGHAGEMRFEYFLQAQATWDETMAESAVAFVDKREDVEGMVMAVGRVHARKSFGIPPRIVRRLEEKGAGESNSDARVAAVLPFEPDEQIPVGSLDLEYLRNQEVADYVWVRGEGGE